MAGLIERGASGTLESGRLSGAPFWASLATGEPPLVHGVTSAREIRPDGGGVQPVGFRSWRAPPIWQILAAEGIATAVIGCPGAAPATAWPGGNANIVVDEYFAMAAGSLAEDWPLRPDCIAPPRLRPALRPCRVHPEELDEQAGASLPAAPLGIAVGNHAAATWVAEHEDWQILVVHHALLASDRNDTAYGLIDAMLARLHALAGPQTDIIIVSSSGVLIACGAGFEADTMIHGAAPADIATTVLAHFGLRTTGAGRSLRVPVGSELRSVTPATAPPPSPTVHTPAPSPLAARMIDQLEREAAWQNAWTTAAGGDYAGAVTLIESALARTPDHPDLLFLLGHCRFFLGEADPCGAIGARLSAVAPDCPSGALLQGAACMLREDERAAEPHLEEAMRLAGDDATAYVRLGAVMLHAGRYSQAERHYGAALARDPESAEARAGIGLACVAQGDDQAGERHIRAALAQRYHAPALHYQLGAVYAAQSRWPEAAQALRTALAQHPGLDGAARLLRKVEDGVAAKLAEAARTAT